jgi:hypothetical protein
MKYKLLFTNRSARFQTEASPPVSSKRTDTVLIKPDIYRANVATLGDQSHRTAKAIAWIRANYTKQLRVEHLAEIAGMGVSTLHHHFRGLTAMSPLQYQKQLRLQAARATCFWMVWTRRVQALRSDTKASANSIANTAVFSASHRCGIFGPFTHRALRHWSRSVIGKPCRIVCSG